MAPPHSHSKKKHPGKAILAGGISGGIEVCISYPTEFVKTQLQLYEGARTGAWDVVKHTVNTRGVLGLYRGLSPLLYFSIPKVAVRFSAYELIKNKLQGNSTRELTKTQTFLAGLGAGTSEAILAVTPMETIKVKFIHDQHQAVPKYRGFFHGVSTIIKDQGIAGTYKGLLPTILKQSTNQGIRFVVYGEVTKWLKGEDPTQQLSVWKSILAGAVAGAASVFGNTPIDVIKTRMQGLDSHKYSSSWDCMKSILKNEGPLALYKGTTPRLYRVCMDTALVFTLYEQVTKALDLVWKTDY